MANDMKSGVGFIIPATSVVGFFTSLLLGQFLFSIIIAIAGILVWFLYMLVMESNIPEQMGNMIILFGVMLSLGIFFGFGLTQNMWGGFEFQPEGSILSLVILFFAVITGLNFRNQQTTLASSNGGSGHLSDEDRDLVMNAINQNKTPNEGSVQEPKVIVVKQEMGPAKVQEPDENKDKLLSSSHDPYAMTNNPYFAYPPDYYYDSEEDELEEDEWDEDEWDEDEDE